MKSHRLTYLALAVLATCSLVLQSVHGAKLPVWQHDADNFIRFDFAIKIEMDNVHTAFEGRQMNILVGGGDML